MGTLVKNVVINWSKSYETISFMRFLVMKLNSYDDTFDDGDNDDIDEIDTGPLLYLLMLLVMVLVITIVTMIIIIIVTITIDTVSVVFADGQALWNVTDGVTG